MNAFRKRRTITEQELDFAEAKAKEISRLQGVFAARFASESAFHDEYARVVSTLGFRRAAANWAALHFDASILRGIDDDPF